LPKGCYVITTKNGATVVAGGLLTAGLAYLFARHNTRRSARLAHAEESGPRVNEPKLRLHEVSSMVGDHALAPDRAAIGEPLADLEIVELPIGQTSDMSYSAQLRQDKWPQPDTTGTVLEPPAYDPRDFFVEALDAPVALEAEYDDDLQDFDGGVSARPAAHPHNDDEEDDGMTADDLGARFLSRATEAPRFEDEPDLELTMAPWEWSSTDSQRLDEDRASALSEASLNASRSPNDEELVVTEEEEPLSIPIDVEVPPEVWDTSALSEKRG
jgi:hypothetical protein